MTASITIVNDSNWSGEVVEVGAYGPLAPGESVKIGLVEKPVTYTVQRNVAGKNLPYYNAEGNQIFPHVVVEWRDREGKFSEPPK